MYNLIRNNVIQFDKLIISNYFKLNLDEVDTIILIRLHDLSSRGINVLNDEDIASSMRINKNELGKRIVNLVKNGFITLELSSVEAKEIFSLDELYRRLAFIIEGEKQQVNKDVLDNEIQTTISLLEKELKKILSPIEIEVVKRWYLEEQYSKKEIDEAILKALKNKSRGIMYIDRLLQANARDKKIEEKKVISSEENIKDMFNKLYVKSK